MDRLSAVARDPGGYVEGWRARHRGRLVLGVLPMNFPRELALAAGTLPVVVQDDQKPVIEGRSLLAEFYCGYTRNLAGNPAGYAGVLRDAEQLDERLLGSGAGHRHDGRVPGRAGAPDRRAGHPSGAG